MDSSNPAPISAKALTFLVRIMWHQNARLGQCLGPNQEWQALTLLLPSPLQLPFPSWSRRQKGLAWLMASDRLPHLGAADNLRQACEGLGLTMTSILGAQLHQQPGVHIPIQRTEIHDFSFTLIASIEGNQTHTQRLGSLYIYIRLPFVQRNAAPFTKWKQIIKISSDGERCSRGLRAAQRHASCSWKRTVYAYGNQPVDGRRGALRGYLPFPLLKGKDAFKYIRPESFYILPPTCSNSKALTQGTGCHLLDH